MEYLAQVHLTVRFHLMVPVIADSEEDVWSEAEHLVEDDPSGWMRHASAEMVDLSTETIDVAEAVAS